MGRLKQATVMVFGVGGVGSHCIEALARSGAGRLILIDNDKVSLTNINRQSIAYHSTIGRMKTEVMRRELKARGIRHLKVLYSPEKPVDTSGRETGEDKGARRILPGSISFVPPVAGLLIAEIYKASEEG